MQQLVFDFTLSHQRKNYHHIDFFVNGQNTQMLRLFRHWLAHEQGHAYIFGAPMSGCSRLLRAACHAKIIAGEKAACLASISDLLDAIHADIASSHALLAIDNLESILGHMHNEELLYELFDRATDKNCNLLFTAHKPSSALSYQLTDLRTRLASCLQIGLKPLEDKALEELAEQLLTECGSDASTPGIGALMLNYIQRDSAAVVECIRTIQHQSIVYNKPITRSFIRRYLQSL